MTTTPVPSDVPTEPPQQQRGLIRTPTCLHCGYLLEGVPDGRCPECGHEMVFEAPDASGRRMACGQFGGPWRYARAVMYGIAVLWLTEILPWHWDIRSIGQGTAVLLFIFGILSVVAGWSAALYQRSTIRAPIFSAVSDVFQWLLLIPLLFLFTKPVAAILASNIELQFRYVYQASSFYSSLATIVLMSVGVLSLFVVKKRWPAVSRQCGLPDFVTHSKGVSRTMLTMRIATLFIVGLIVLYSALYVISTLQDLL